MTCFYGSPGIIIHTQNLSMKRNNSMLLFLSPSFLSLLVS